jgi:hypothetical protein
MKNFLSMVAKATVTIVLLIFLFRKVDFHEFWTTLGEARVDLLFLSFLVLWIGHFICIFRWRLLMRPLMPVPSVGQLFRIYCIGLFFNLTFPTVVGGDIVKIYYAGKSSKSYAQSFAATFLDRDAGMLAMMIIACLATVIHPVSVTGIHVSLIVWLASLAFVLGNVAIFMPRVHRLCTRLLHNVRLPKIAGKIDRLSDAFQVMSRERSVLTWSLAISMANQFLVISASWLIAEGLRMNLPLLYFLLFVPVITLISMIPVSLNGMGLREYAFVSLFTAVGATPSSCVALGLLSSLAIILSAIPGGLMYVFFRERSDAREMAAVEADF